jgi:hypothetical protein
LSFVNSLCPQPRYSTKLQPAVRLVDASRAL